MTSIEKEQAWILHLESATQVCSVAVSRGAELIAIEETNEPNMHAKQMTLFVASVLEKAGIDAKDLSAVAVTGGPGSYTGLRVGASIAKGICYGLGIPLIAVDTLASLAKAILLQHDVGSEDLIIPMIDARRMEVYAAIFNTKMQEIEPLSAHIIDNNIFSLYFASSNCIIFTGDGAPKSQTLIQDPKSRFIPLDCSAAHLVPLAWEKFQNKQFEDIAYFSPNYLKSPHITTPRRSIQPLNS